MGIAEEKPGLMDKITTGIQSVPPRVLLYGPEGVGKSTFAASTPKPIFIQAEDGLTRIDCARFPLVRSFDDVVSAVAELIKQPHEFRTIIIDTLDALEFHVWDTVCREWNDGQSKGKPVANIAEIGYNKGFTLALKHWNRLLNGLTILRDQRKMMVCLLAHCKVEKVEDPEVPTYDRFASCIHKIAASRIIGWCDAVLFATKKTLVRKEDEYGRERNVALNNVDAEHMLRCIGSASCTAKNRYGLPATLPFPHTNAWSVLRDSIFPNHPKAQENKEEGNGPTVV